MDKLKEIYEKASDVFFAFTSKFDGISEKIYEKTKNTCIFKNTVILYISTVQYPSQCDRFPGRA